MKDPRVTDPLGNSIDWQRQPTEVLREVRSHVCSGLVEGSLDQIRAPASVAEVQNHGDNDQPCGRNAEAYSSPTWSRKQQDQRQENEETGLCQQSCHRSQTSQDQRMARSSREVGPRRQHCRQAESGAQRVRKCRNPEDRLVIARLQRKQQCGQHGNRSTPPQPIHQHEQQAYVDQVQGEDGEMERQRVRSEGVEKYQYQSSRHRVEHLTRFDVENELAPRWRELRSFEPVEVVEREPVVQRRQVQQEIEHDQNGDERPKRCRFPGRFFFRSPHLSKGISSLTSVSWLPHSGALPGCATSRLSAILSSQFSMLNSHPPPP